MAAVFSQQTYHGDPGQAAGREAAVTVLPNAHHQTIGNLDIRAAGRDMHISTVNVTVQYTPAVQQAAVFLPKARQGTRVQAPTPTEPRRLNLSSFLNFCQIVFNVVFCRGRDHKAGGSINVIALESDRAVDLPPSLLPTHPEIYVRALLKDGLGLPCWEPKPLQANMLPEGVVPGDVGTYTVDRSFKKLFNLWEDESAIQTLAATCSAGMYRALRGRTISEPMLQEGETLREGAHVTSHLTGSSSAEPAVLHEFRCYSQSGAVLALTTPAHLLTTDDKDAMQSFIVQHVEAIYRHASSIRRLGETESLYVITGCVKSESWAIAAYNEYMQPFDNILQLVRIPPSPQAAPISRPKHQWTKQGTSRKCER